MKLKVCGMKYKDNLKLLSELSVDYFGFIFYEKSPRFFDSEIPKLNPSIKKVGVFVDADVEDILEKVKTYGLDAIQLHGKESPKFCKALKNKFKQINKFSEIKIIKVFSMKDEFDFNVLEPYEACCDYYLFDTKGKLPGGNGYTFNWGILKKYNSTKPYFLSGGIGINSEADLKEFFKTPASKYCYAIDVNSKFEIEPGLKDIELIKKFITKVKE